MRHVGDPVAFIVADSIKQARDAAEAIEVDYEFCRQHHRLAAAMDKGGAGLAGGAAQPRVRLGDRRQGRHRGAFAKAAHVTKLTVVNNRIVVNSMEARAALADFDAATGRWTLYANTQGGWLVKNLIGPLFGTDPEKFRIITPDVGGGFGMKLFLYAEHVLTCYAARKLGRPVKWAADRGEAFLCDTQGRDNLTLGELAIDADGKFLALRTRNVSNMGAYLSTFAPYIPTFAGTGCWPASTGSRRSMPTCWVCSPTPCRWTPIAAPAGRRATIWSSGWSTPRPANWASTRRIAPAQHGAARRRCRTPRRWARLYDSGDFRTCWTPRSRQMDYAGFAVSPGRGRVRRQAARLGLAYYLEATGGDPTERAEIRFADDGFVDVYVGTQSTGQGHETAYVQLTAAQPWASTAKRSASARATPTPSRSAAGPAARAAFTPRARRSC